MPNETKEISGTSNSTQFNVTLEDNSTYEWNCLTYDQAGNSDWADENFTLYLPFPVGFYQYPTISFYNETTEIIRFEANKAVNGTVEYGTTPSYGSTINLPEHKIAHEFNITGLTKGTKYYYRVNITNISGGFAYFDSFNSSFVTADDDLTSFTFAVFGDTRAHSGIGVGLALIKFIFIPLDTRAHSGIGVNKTVFGPLTSQIINIKPNLVFNVGDAVEAGGNNYETARSAWKEYTDVVWNLTDHIPAFIAIGNHENPEQENSLKRYREVVIHPLNGDGMMERWNETTYWFRYGNSLFISLNTEERNETTNYENSIVGNQKDWLNKTLNMTGFTHKFVFLHRPVEGAINRRIINHVEIDNMFDYYNVTAVFAGHEHYYCRNNTATLYIITGGGGAELKNPLGNCAGSAMAKQYHFVNITVDGDTIHGNAINLTGDSIDTFNWNAP